MQLGATWCILVRMAAKRTPARKRFTISLDGGDYERLLALAGEHKPPLTLQYVVNYAIQRLLSDANDPQLALQLGDPLGRRGRT